MISGTHVLGGEFGRELDEALSLSLHRGTGGGAGGKGRDLVAGIFFAEARGGGGGGVGARGLAVLQSCRGGGGGVGNLAFGSIFVPRMELPFSVTLRARLLDRLGEFRKSIFGPGCEASPIRPLGFFRDFCRT